MRKEQEINCNFALAIALAVIPMNGVAYLSLCLAFMALSARTVWLSVRPKEARFSAIVATIGVLVLILAPEVSVHFNIAMR